MPEALVEAGVGATRALVIEGGQVVEAWLEPDDGLRAGDVARGRLLRVLVPGRRGIVALAGVEALLEPLPAGLTEGGPVDVEVTREAIHESGRSRLAKVRALSLNPRAVTPAKAGVHLLEPPEKDSRLRRGDDAWWPAPTLAARLAARMPVRRVAPRDPALDSAGWPDAAEAAESGSLAFSGGLLTITPTPAMTVIDVDGPGEPVALAETAALAVARAVRLLDLGGSLGVDFPTVAGRASRNHLGELLDRHLPPPFERTGVNGFGFVQIVRPKLRASLVERARGDPVGWTALALLRAAERAAGGGPCTLAAAPPVIAWLEARPRLAPELARRLGAPVALRIDSALPISAAHAQRAHP